MQTNRTLKIAIAIVAAFMLFLFFRGCFDKRETITIQTKEAKGSFKAVKPESIIIHDTIRQIVSSQKVSDNQQPLIDSLLTANKALNDAFALSINKDELYKQAIELRSFNHTFDDSLLTAKVTGISRGTIESLKMDYTIKPRTEKIKVPQPVFRVLTGVEVGMTTVLGQINFKANVMLQNKRGDVLSVSVDSGSRYYLGYNFSIFDLKR